MDSCDPYLQTYYECIKFEYVPPISIYRGLLFAWVSGVSTSCGQLARREGTPEGMYDGHTNMIYRFLLRYRGVLHDCCDPKVEGIRNAWERDATQEVRDSAGDNETQSVN